MLYIYFLFKIIIDLRTNCKIVHWLFACQFSLLLTSCMKIIKRLLPKPGKHNWHNTVNNLQTLFRLHHCPMNFDFCFVLIYLVKGPPMTAYGVWLSPVLRFPQSGTVLPSSSFMALTVVITCHLFYIMFLRLGLSDIFLFFRLGLCIFLGKNVSNQALCDTEMSYYSFILITLLMCYLAGFSAVRQLVSSCS